MRALRGFFLFLSVVVGAIVDIAGGADEILRGRS